MGHSGWFGYDHAGFMPPIPNSKDFCRNEVWEFLYLQMLYQGEFPIQPVFKFKQKSVDAQTGGIEIEDTSQTSLV